LGKKKGKMENHKGGTQDRVKDGNAVFSKKLKLPAVRGGKPRTNKKNKPGPGANQTRGRCLRSEMGKFSQSDWETVILWGS